MKLFLINLNNLASLIVIINLAVTVISDPTVAGTAVNFLAKNCPNPLLIIKDPILRADKKNNVYRFGVCFDGSAKAIAVLKTVIDMMDDCDKLTVITCKEANIKMDGIEKQISQVYESHPAGSRLEKPKMVVLEREAGQNVYKAIQHYLISQGQCDCYIDFVAVGNTGVNYLKNKGTTLGSVANMVVRAKRMNVIFAP